LSSQNNFRERLALRGELDPRQYNSGRAVRHVLQSLALQVKKGTFPARLHDFQNECAAVRCLNVKIVVILARQGSGANFQPIYISSQLSSVVM